MKILKGYPIVYKARDFNRKVAEVEYLMKSGNIVSVIDLKCPTMKLIYDGLDTQGKQFSVELIEKNGGHRIILMGAQLMDYNELRKFCEDHNK